MKWYKLLLLFFLIFPVSNYSINNLIRAIASNDQKQVEILLHYGVNPNQENNEGITPLIQAATANNIQIANILMMYGASSSYHNRHGKTALDYARDNIPFQCQLKYSMYVHYKPDMLNLFLAHYLKSVQSYYKFHNSAFNMHEYSTLKKSLYNHEDVAFDLQNPLHYALLKGDRNCIEKIISYMPITQSNLFSAYQKIKHNVTNNIVIPGIKAVYEDRTENFLIQQSNNKNKEIARILLSHIITREILHNKGNTVLNPFIISLIISFL